MRVTAQQVAREADVSVSTVSRALAGSEVVAEETRVRVRAAAAKLGYAPLRPAAAASATRPRTIGLLCPDLANPYFAMLAKSAQSHARSRGFGLLVADSDEDVIVEMEIARHLSEHVDGVVLCSPRSSSEAISVFARNTKTVLAHRTIEGVPSITVDEHHSVSKVVGHLKALGHHRIAYVGGPEASNSEAVRSAAILPLADEETEIVHVGHVQPTSAGGFSSADLVLSTGVTAVIAFNDLVALGIIARLRERGKSVPKDISVSGFDDVISACSIWPALTTVSMPLMRIGAQTIEVLLKYLDTGQVGESPPQHVGELVVRASTGVPQGMAA